MTVTGVGLSQALPWGPSSRRLEAGDLVVVDFAAQGHGPLGHLLAIFGHSRRESMVDKLMPMLKDAGFSDVEGIPTRHKNFAFIRAR